MVPQKCCTQSRSPLATDPHQFPRAIWTLEKLRVGPCSDKAPRRYIEELRCRFPTAAADSRYERPTRYLTLGVAVKLPGFLASLRPWRPLTFRAAPRPSRPLHHGLPHGSHRHASTETSDLVVKLQRRNPAKLYHEAHSGRRLELFLQQGPVIRACQLLGKDVQPSARLRIEEVEADSLVCGEVSRSHISLEDVFPCGRAHLRGRVPVIEAFRSLE